MRGSSDLSLRSYVVVTGTVFGLLTLAHLLRIVEEGSHLATDIGWVLITVASAGLCLWACRLLWRSSRP
jgi:hypothetical protein